MLEESHPLMRAVEHKYDLPTHYDEEGRWKKDGAPLSWNKETVGETPIPKVE